MMMSQQQQQQKRVATVFRGEVRLGEVEVFPAKTRAFRFPKNEIRISHLTPASERCNPLAVLQTIAPFAVMCKIRSTTSDPDNDPLNHLYNSCLRQLSTAVVVLLPSEELHLVPLPSRSSSPNLPCFWCFAAPTSLYSSCLSMLNPRCLSIVFDLDETLFVANTMKSFEDKIDALSNRIDAEDDPARVSGMSAELKRYLEDRALLKQYVDTDSVVDSNGKLLSFHNEEVPPLTPNHNSFFRPVIRLPDRNIVLTRINPEIRDTSVLVRLRPAWDELRSYVIAKGRKRFEVYVCTMAERDYALEMWRLLDPESHLINSNQLLDRIVCVKSGSRKSLVNVFQGRSCHPKLAMVIDDRLNVWDEKDQPRLHVVPPFTPYYAPQAEMANLVPVLCVARNVACNVRGGFFREFDDNLLRKIGEFHYEDEILDLPFPPEASDYLMSEDPGVVVGNNKDPSVSEGANGAETECRITQSQKGVLIGTDRDLTASDRTNGSDIETKIEHVSIPEEGGRKLQANNSSLPDGEVPKKHACASTNNNNFRNEEGTSPLVSPSLAVDVLYEIGRKCNAKIEFKTVATSNNDDLQFLVEVLFGSESMEPGNGMTFSTEKIGAGTGKTRKEAQLQAAANALQHLSNHYVEFIENANGVRDDCSTKHFPRKDCGFLDEDATQDFVSSPKKEALNECSSPAIGATADKQSRLPALISDIKQFLHANEGHSLVFQDKPPASVSLCKGDYYAQVETAGRVLGKGICSSKEGAKLQAAEDALKALKVSDSQSLKRVPSGRLPQVGSVKRPKEEVARQ